MSSQRYYWLKLHDDFFRDNSIKKLRKIAGGDTYTIIYLKMLLLSLPTDGKLYYDGLEDCLATQLALEMDEDADNVKVTLSFLEARGILVKVTDDEFELTQVKEMVGSESESARRMRKYRLGKADVKQLTSYESEPSQCNNNVPQCNNDVTIDIRDKSLDIRAKETEKENTNTPFIPQQGEMGRGDISESVSHGSKPKATRSKKEFVAPTLAEVEEYCKSRNSTVDPKYFWEHFDAGDWHDASGKPVQRWKQKLVTWERNGWGSQGGGQYKSGKRFSGDYTVDDDTEGYI